MCWRRGRACCADQGQLAARQVDGEDRSLAQGALDGDPSAVALGHVPDYGETQARPAGRLGAGLVNAVEPLEDPGELPLGDADACVGYLDDDLGAFHPACYLDPAAGWGVIDGVVQEVGKHRGELRLVSADRVLGGLAEAPPLQGYVFSAGYPPHPREHGHQHAAHVHEGWVLWPLLALQARQVKEVGY